MSLSTTFTLWLVLCNLQINNVFIAVALISALCIFLLCFWQLMHKNVFDGVVIGSSLVSFWALRKTSTSFTFYSRIFLFQLTCSIFFSLALIFYFFKNLFSINKTAMPSFCTLNKVDNGVVLMTYTFIPSL